MKKAKTSSPRHQAHSHKEPSVPAHALAAPASGNSQPLTLARLDAMPAVVVEENKFSLVNRLHEQARLSMAQSCAFMILAGFELISLRKDAKHGEWEKHFAGERSGKSRSDATFGFSYDTARRYMDFAKAAKKNIAALQEVPLGELTLDQLSAEQRAIVLKAVHKTGDGSTYQQLAWEWNLAKKSAGHALKNSVRKNTPAKKGDKDSPEKAAIDLWAPMIRDLETEGLKEKSWAHLPDAHLRQLKGLLVDLNKLIPHK